MKLIESNVEYIPQAEGLEGIYRQIEIAGRTAYKSEDKITDSSAKKFVDMLIRNKHYAALEHGTVYMKIPDKTFQRDIYKWKIMIPNGCPYVHMNSNSICYYITTNYRYILEGDIGIETAQNYLCEP